MEKKSIKLKKGGFYKVFYSFDYSMWIIEVDGISRNKFPLGRKIYCKKEIYVDFTPAPIIDTIRNLSEASWWSNESDFYNEQNIVEELTPEEISLFNKLVSSPTSEKYLRKRWDELMFNQIYKLL